MKNIIRLFIFTLFIFSAFSFSQSSEKVTLNLKVTNIKKAVGDIYVAVFSDEKAYMKDDQRFAEAIAKVETEGEVDIQLQIPIGKYAVTIFHDVNGDAELSTNFIGIPKEPYGFSNNPKSTFGPPSFEESVFEFKEDGQQIEIELK